MKRLLLAGLCLIVSQQNHAEIDPQALAFNCRNCHADNPPEHGVPGLSMLSKNDIRHSLLDFKSGKKPATIMQRLAKGYSDAELNAVADFLGKP